jgi:hypothetical protein
MLIVWDSLWGGAMQQDEKTGLWCLPSYNKSNFALNFFTTEKKKKKYLII